MTPERLRAYVLILIRDVLLPVVGAGGFLYGLKTGALAPWHLPIIAGLCGVPLVARGAPAESDGTEAP